MSQAHPREVSAHPTVSRFQAKGRHQARIGQDADGPGVLVIEGSWALPKVRHSQEHADHTVVAGEARHLAGTAVDNHACRLERGSDSASVLGGSYTPPSPGAS